VSSGAVKRVLASSAPIETRVCHPGANVPWFHGADRSGACMLEFDAVCMLLQAGATFPVDRAATTFILSPDRE
jgi:hypothetical protein